MVTCHGDLVQNVFLAGKDIATRIYSWVMRFISNCHVNKEHRMKGELSLDEIRDTKKLIIKNMQREVFYNEYICSLTEKKTASNRQ